MLRVRVFFEKYIMTRKRPNPWRRDSDNFNKAPLKINIPERQPIELVSYYDEFKWYYPNSEIKTRRVVVGQREVKDSNWWNPFSWGRKKLVDITEERESVVLDELWKARSLELRKPFDQLLEDGMQHIQNGANDIVDLYVKFMSAEFDKQFDSVILELTEKIKDKDKRLHAINLAKQELKWIEDFRSELNSTLMIKGSH